MSGAWTLPWADGLPVRPGPAPTTDAGWRQVTREVAAAIRIADWARGMYRLVDTSGREPSTTAPSSLLLVPTDGPLSPGAAVVAAVNVGHTLGARLSHVTADDLPDGPPEAISATIAHIAAAQGVPLTPTITVHLLAPVIDIPLTLDDAVLAWANVDPQTGRPQGDGARILGDDAMIPFPSTIERMLRLLRDPGRGTFAA